MNNCVLNFLDFNIPLLNLTQVRQTDKKTGRQAGRQADRQIEFLDFSIPLTEQGHQWEEDSDDGVEGGGGF